MKERSAFDSLESKSIALKQIESDDYHERTIGYEAYKQFYKDSKKEALFFIDKLEKEQKLYPRLKIQQLLSLGGIDTFNELINKLIDVNSVELPISKKRSSPLPRNLKARIIGNMGSLYFEEGINKINELGIKRLTELLPGLGFLLFYNKVLDTPDNFIYFKELLNKNIDDPIITQRLITLLSGFKQIDNILYLDDLKRKLSSEAILKEIERTITLVYFESILKSNVTLICASKYFDTSELRKLSKKGITNFGENKTFDFLEKKRELKQGSIKWHFIGHLQRNKVKDIINEMDCLHSLDSLELAEMINKYRNTELECFVELNLIEEETKSGITVQNIDTFLLEIKKYDKIKVVGFMCLGKQGDLLQTEAVFRVMNELKKKHDLPYLSMGMSDDFILAIKHGSTHVRLGKILRRTNGIV